jgi:hypothetical protein
MGKLDERTEQSGRYWGVRGDVPFSPLLEMVIDMQTALDFRRAVRRVVGFKSKRFGFWCANYSVDFLTYVSWLENNLPDQVPEHSPMRYSMTSPPPFDIDDYFFS